MHPDDYLVVASNDGAATQPTWGRNIAANPAVTIRRGAPRYPSPPPSVWAQFWPPRPPGQRSPAPQNNGASLAMALPAAAALVSYLAAVNSLR